MKNIYVLLAIAAGVICFASKGLAHDCFKLPLEERYKLKTVSCKTCHPNNKDRSIHNKLGIMFENALKGKDLSKKFKEAEAKGDEAKAEYEKEMVEEFRKVMVEIEQQKMTLKDMIEFGLINGMRLNPEGVAAADAALANEKKAAESTETSEKTDQ